MAGLVEVGPWAKEKLRSLGHYLEFYTKVLKNQPWRTIYLDAYAGGGRAAVRGEGRPTSGGPSLFGSEPSADSELRELIDGSPRVALGIANPFDHYIFADPHPDRAAELNALKAEFSGSRTIDVHQKTAADCIDWIAAQPISKRSHRGVAFLDPFGADLNWVSVKKLAESGLFEVVVNFSLSMTIQRMLPNSGEVPESWATALDRYFGGRIWFNEVYQRREGLFDAGGFEKRPDYSARLLQLYRMHLRTAFGHVSKPRLIRNSRGGPLYYLLWAGPNKKGLEGADYILTMGERVGRGDGRARSVKQAL